jgi:hypothetical protein
MALETGNYIDDLVITNPTASDPISQGDDHLQLIKKVVKQSFPSVDAAVHAIHPSDTAPSTSLTAGLMWFDTSANLLKIRNEANDAWVTLAVSIVTSNSVDVNAGTIDGAVIGGSSAAAGTFTGLVLTEDGTLAFEGATDDAYEITLTVVDPTADRTVSLPNATDTLVGKATTDTLTNKTLTSPTINAGALTGAFTGTADLTGLVLQGASPLVFEGATSDAYETTIAVTDPTADRTLTLPNATDTLVGKATTDTLTNKTLTSPVFNTGVSGSAVLDEDDMSSDSATKVATQQSIKAYVTAQITAEDLDIATDSGTIDIDLNSETLTISGGEGIDTSASGTTVTIAGEEASTSNKGVASFSSDNFSVSSGAVTIKDAGVANAELANMAANTIKVRDANSSGVPSDKALATTQILIGDGTGFTAAALSSDVTMTNAGAVTIADNAVSLAKMAGLARGKIIYGDSSGDPAALAVGSSAQVLTSDGTDISWSTPTVGDITSVVAGSGMTGGGTTGDVTLNVIGGTGITANADDIAIDSTVTTLTGSQTLTNKTLTSPTINAGTLSGAFTGTADLTGTVLAGASPLVFEGATADAYETTLAITDPTADRTITLPNATDTLVGKATTDTLTNKTLTSPAFGGTATTFRSTGIDDNADALAMTIDSSENIGIGLTAPKTKLTVEGSLTLKEQAAADGDTAAYGQLWVKTATPNQLYFTDDAGTDVQLVAGGATVGSINDLTDALVENNSIWLGSDPSGTTDTASYSVAVGTTALDAITTGDNNTAIGYDALTANTTGANNVGVGQSALQLLTTGSQNTAVGQGALDAATTVDGITAVGHAALSALTTGVQNQGFGHYAGAAVTTGTANTLVGHRAGVAITTGTTNTIVGPTAGDAITTSSGNICIGVDAGGAITTAGSGGNLAIGNYAGQHNQTGYRNVAVGSTSGGGTGSYNVSVGYGAFAANDTGGQNTCVGDASGAAITTGGQNTCIGYAAADGITTGASNTAIGNAALSACTTAGSNTVVGSGAMASSTSASGCVAIGGGAFGGAVTTGANSVAIGINAGYTTTSGASNVLIGYACGDANTTGGGNTAVGYNALTANTTGTVSTAIGNTALAAQTTGSGNTALGETSLQNLTTSVSNVAIGNNALGDVTTGVGQNVGIGRYAGMKVTTGTSNVYMGYYCGPTATTGASNTAVGNGAYELGTTGSSNTCIGANAGNVITTGSNNSCLGNDADASGATVSNEFTLGNTAVDNLRCADTSISALSDERDKAEIADLPSNAGLDFVNSLRPVTFYWDNRDWYSDGSSDGSKITHDYNNDIAKSGQRMGFIAQEVKDSISGMKYMEDSQVVNGTEEKLEFAPAHLITPLVKAIQQLSAEVESLKAQL